MRLPWRNSNGNKLPHQNGSLLPGKVEAGRPAEREPLRASALLVQGQWLSASDRAARCDYCRRLNRSRQKKKQKTLRYMRLEALSRSYRALPHNALPQHSLTHAPATATIVYAHIQMVTHKERRFSARARKHTHTRKQTRAHAGI